MVKWSPTSLAPLAVVRHSLGQAGEIDSETAAIAFEYNLPPEDFEPAVLACLPPTPWVIPDEARAARRSLQVSIFTWKP